MQVSVIIPTYNYGRYLAAAIASVQNQTTSDLEILVIDDGSTDNTCDVLASMRDDRLRAVRIPNSGLSAARNTGLRMARGEYIAFLDADDLWRPDKLERQLAMMAGEPSLGLVFTDFVRFDERGEYPDTQFSFVPELASIPSRPSAQGSGRVILADAFASLVRLTQSPAWPSTLLVRADSVRGIQFRVAKDFSEDLHYNLQAFLRAPVGYVTDPLAELRRHDRNITVKYDERNEPNIRALLALDQESLTLQQREALRWRLGREWASLGYVRFWNDTRDRRKTARAYLQSLLYPGSRRTALTHLLAIPFRRFLRERIQVSQ